MTDVKLPEPDAWMRQFIRYSGTDGRTDGERVVSERKVLDDDIPLFTADQLTAAVMADRDERWRPIETAPRDGTWILGWRKGWDAPHTMRHAISGWRSEGCHVSPGPTHFQPIQPPAEDGDVHEQD